MPAIGEWSSTRPAAHRDWPDPFRCLELSPTQIVLRRSPTW